MTNEQYFDYVNFCCNNLIPIPTQEDLLPYLPYTKADIYLHVLSLFKNRHKPISYRKLKNIVKYVNEEYIKSEEERLTKDKLELTYSNYLKYKLQFKLRQFHTINVYDEMIIDHLIGCYEVFN